MDWVAAIIQLVGVYLNARKNLWCWPFWCLGAIIWVIYGSCNDQWAMVLLNAFFFGFNIYGWRRWLKERP